ncbi:MAG: efflux RND transporter permease subunit [Bradymonadaceae bacterium]
MDVHDHNAVGVFFRRFVGRHYLIIALLSVIITALAILTIATKWNINSDFKSLLPENSAAAQAMEEVGDRVGSGSSLFVVIDSPDGDANLEFAKQYAEKLRELPEIALAHFHNDKAFFDKHQLLYLDVEDLDTLHDRIRARIRRSKQRANPLFVDLRRPSAEPEDGFIDTRDIEEKYEDLAHQDYKEYLVADDGYSLTIVVRFVETSTDLAATNRLLDNVRRVGDELEPAKFHEEMVLEFGGGLVHRQQEYTSIVDDIKTSAIFTIFGLFFVIALYFRRFRAVVFVLSPLIMGVLWTLALAFLFFGELTTISVFIFAILLGLGIDFSIHLLSGYDRERLEGQEPVDALIRCYNGIGRATVIGASTTFATFVVLSFAQFRGLSQFGQVASLGVLCTLFAMIVVLPAFILTLHRLRPHTPNAQRTLLQVLKFDRWYTERTFSRLIPLTLTLGIVFTILAAFNISDLYFEENFRKVGQVEVPWAKQDDPLAEQELLAIRAARRLAVDVRRTAVEVRSQIEPETFIPDRKQRDTGAKYTSALSGKHSSTPTILLLDDAQKTARVYRHMQAMHLEGKLPSVRSIASIHAFLPGTEDEQKERLEVIEDIRELIEGENLDRLSDEDRKEVEEFQARLEVEEPVTIVDLPPWTKRLFREAGPEARPAADGEEFAYEYLIYVNEAIDHMIGEQARRFLGEVQQVAEETGVDVRIGSQSYIYTAMLDEIKEDGTRMLGLALIIVFLMLSFFFRSPIRATVALLPLLVGAVWMFGFCAWFGIKLDFFNVIILPVVIGIGIDDGVHFYHRYLELGRGSILRVLHHVGSAIAMTTVTSIIGFGGLAITNYAGLQSIGYLAITGIASAFLATFLLLPTLLWLAERFEVRWVLPREPV